MSYDDVEDEDDDLYLTDVKFVNEWLPRVADGLRSFSISDFWVQSCWRRSDVLSLISSYCESSFILIFYTNYLLYLIDCQLCSFYSLMKFFCFIFLAYVGSESPLVINLV